MILMKYYYQNTYPFSITYIEKNSYKIFLVCVSQLTSLTFRRTLDVLNLKDM